MRKLYISPSIGRSHDLPESLSRFFSHEEATYRCSVFQSQLDDLDEDVPPNFFDSYKTGTEKITEEITTIFGKKEIIHRWDFTGTRFYIEFDSLEEVISDIMEITGLRVTINRRNLDNQLSMEIEEMVFGYPEIENSDWVCELETDVPDLGLAGNVEKDNSNSWKNG